MNIMQGQYKSKNICQKVTYTILHEFQPGFTKHEYTFTNNHKTLYINQQ